MKRLLFVVPLLMLAPGCKGKVEVRDNPELVRKLESSQTELSEKKKYVAELESRLKALEGNTADGEVVITLNGPLPEGSIMEIKGGAGPHARAKATPKEPRGNADDEKLYTSFLAALKQSRESIKKCYQGALKKDTRLQARTITLNIAVNYQSSGKVSSATFNPPISSSFNRCMSTIAQGWKLPAMPRRVSFNYRQTLTPE